MEKNDWELELIEMNLSSEEEVNRILEDFKELYFLDLSKNQITEIKNLSPL